MDTEQYDGICLSFFFSVHTLFTDSQKCYSTIRPPIFDEMRKAES